MRSFPLSLFLLGAGLCGCAEILGYGDDTSAAAGNAGTAGAGAATSAGGTAGTATTSSGAAGTSSGGAAGSAGSVACTDGDSQSCYEGPPGTDGIGLCKAGLRSCKAGKLGPCEGQVKPTVERCGTQKDDESCDDLATCTGLYRWGHDYGGPKNQIVDGVATDSLGNVYVAGNTNEAFKTDPSDPSQMPLAYVGGTDMFLFKLDRQGKLLWAKSFGSAGNDLIRGIRVDKADNVVIVGSIGGAVDFGKGALDFVGANDIFAAKLDPMGNEIWHKSFGDAMAQYFAGVAVDDAGDVLATGTYQGSFAIGDTTLTSLSDMSNNVLVVKLSGADGKPIWAKGFDVAVAQNGVAIAATPSGDALVLANVQGDFNLCGPDVGVANPNDVWLGKLSADKGECVWGHHYAAPLAQMGAAVASLADGSPVFAMYYLGNVDLGGGGMLPGNNVNFSTAVVGLDPGGQYKWANIASANAGPQVTQSLAVDGDDKVIATGQYKASINFGKPEQQLTAKGAYDFFLVKLDPAALGGYLWGRTFANGDAGAPMVAVDPLGNIVLGATLFGATDLGGGTLTSSVATDRDMLIGSFSP